MTVHPSPKNLARDIARQVWPKRQPRRPKPNPDGFPKRVRDIIDRRSGGMCELDACGPAVVRHHRAPRGRGGTSLPWINEAANSLHLAAACHDRIESDRLVAKDNGWLVPRNGTETAADSKVLRRGRWVLLADDGSFSPAPIEGGAA